MTNAPVNPSNILADDENFVELDGLKVRKDSIAAFFRKIDIFEDFLLYVGICI